MKNNLFSPNSCDDDISDSLSSTNSFVPFSQHLSDLSLTDPISSETKKIRKKRNAYGKIDDEKRIQLLEAVQQRGETLKAASKRLGINYSSAKSIIHTYRKEGRILKKSVCSIPYGQLERNNPFENFFSAENLQAKAFNFPSTLNYLDLHQSSTAASSLSENSASSPMIDLSGALGHLGLSAQERSDWLQSLSFETSPPSKFSQIAADQERNSTEVPKIPMMDEVEEYPPTHSRQLLNRLDNFYMNYSDSPLSGGKGNIYGDDSNTNRGNPREFDSFSELVNSFQNPSCVNKFCQYPNEEINTIKGWAI